MSSLYPRPPVYAARPPGIVSLLMLTITHIQAVTSHTHTHAHTQGRFNNRTARSLYRIMVIETSVVGGVKMGNNVSRVGMKPTCLAFRARMLTPHRPCDVTTIPTSTCLCSSLPQRSVQTTTIYKSNNSTYIVNYIAT